MWPSQLASIFREANSADVSALTDPNIRQSRIAISQSGLDIRQSRLDIRQSRLDIRQSRQDIRH